MGAQGAARYQRYPFALAGSIEDDGKEGFQGGANTDDFSWHPDSAVALLQMNRLSMSLPASADSPSY